MPELPEVEQFRRLLETLVSDKECLRLERHSLDKKPPRKFLSDEEIHLINDADYLVVQARRKGKQLCLTIQPKKKKINKSTVDDSQQTRYLFIHMGMTGTISIPTYIPKLKEVKHTMDFPPPYTYLHFSVGSNQACFSDPRKFGSVLLKDSDEEFNELAPDAWTDLNVTALLQKSTKDQQNSSNGGDTSTCVVSCPTTAGILEKLTGQSMGIKAMLLDQKRVVCGVGNWVADEVLYQCEMHPDQNYLNSTQAQTLLLKLHSILNEAISCLHVDKDFPSDWLFHYRWSNKGNGTTSKDSKGKTITFVTSGGRTSAIVASIQKKRAGQKPSQTPATTKVPKKRTKVQDPDHDEQQTSQSASSESENKTKRRRSDRNK
jgi:formamidopyrimidine-DNA glycosylase